MPVPFAERERGRQMEVRLVHTAQERGIGPAGVELLERMHRVAMEVRNRLADDDHDPAYLHPGRSALILLNDAGERDPLTLAATLTLDSHMPEWAPSAAAIAEPSVLELRAAVPLSGADDLAERLVVAESNLRLMALAERLDQLRHAHLWTDLDARRVAHAEACSVYAPVADRTHPVLARRYAWWCRMFGARHLG